MGSKGQPAQFISRGKAYPDTKRKTRLGLKPILPWSTDMREQPSACSPRLLNWEVDYLVSWGNVSHSFRLKGILYLNYVFNLFFTFQVKQSCNLLNYLRNQFHPSVPKGRMLFQWLPLVSSLSCDFLLPEERDPLNNLPRAVTGSHSPVLFVHLSHMTLSHMTLSNSLWVYKWLFSSKKILRS